MITPALPPRFYRLRIWLAVWLGIQLIVVASSPAWGWIVPHEHLNGERLTAAQWQAHWQAHWCEAHPGGAVCESQGDMLPGYRDVTSTLGLDGVLSTLTGAVATLTPDRDYIPPPAYLSGLPAALFNELALDYSPLDPPPVSI